MIRHDAEKNVDSILVDAEYDRKRGGTQTDAQVLREKLIEVLSRPGGYPVK